MRVLIMGAGGVGGYYGARMAQAGHEVTFVARGQHKAAMLQHGLQVHSPLGDAHLVAPKVIESPSSIEPPDIALVCVKLWDTQAAAQAVQPLAAGGTTVLSLQNGVDKDETLTRVLGEAPLLGGVTQIAASIEAPGVIRHLGTMADLIYGEYGGRDSARLQAFDEAARQTAEATGGFTTRVSADIQLDIWKKFSFLAPFAGATCFYRAPIGPIRDDADRMARLERLIGETVAVGRAAGVAFSDNREAEVLEFVAGLPEEMKSSMLHDLDAGRRLELDWLTGAVLRFGERFGVATPESAAVYEALAPYKDGG